jgi:CheY-like chemotaxis protein
MPMASPLIMVIDDDADVRSALTDLFRDQGYRVVGVADGGEGVRYLSREELPQLILLDLMMPVADGWQFRAEQLMNPALASIPVIVITASPDSDATRTLGLDVVAKPFDTRRLLSLVRLHCGGRHGEAAPDETSAVASASARPSQP